MEHGYLNRLGASLWVGLVIFIVTLAAYVVVGRLATANVAQYRVEILQALNARLPFGIEAQQVSGGWDSFTPVIVLTDLRISLPGRESSPLELSRGRMAVDVLNSLRTRSLQMTRLALHGLSLRGELSGDGAFSVAGLGAGDSSPAEPLREFLLNVEQVTLNNNRLILTLPSGEVRNLALDLTLSREGSQRHVQATLSSSAGARIAVLAEGLGDPFRPQSFSGKVYLDMQATDLGAVQDLFAEGAIPVWADGEVDLEVWLSWVDSTPSLQVRLEGGDLLVAAQDASWQVPLQRVALDAELVERDGRWTVFVANLQLENEGVQSTVPRLQLDTKDSSLRVVTGSLSLAPLVALLTAEQAAPNAVSDLLAALNPRGNLSAIQLSISDLYQPSSDWQLEVNFENLALAPYHGAPGAEAVTGYTKLTPAGGLVILDSQATSLDFPAIYREPLHFDDLYGSLHLNWDTDVVRLSSGLLTTEGEEGTAKVLFSLNIPLVTSDVGIEMDLLVGLKDTHPVHRVKYVPYILAPGLLAWLTDSIGDGLIKQGAFLWRGSLRPGATDLHTVQLAFNVEDTQLSYHPQWPPVLVEQGIVMIDDSNVSVWAEQASLFESRVEQLSVETRVDAANHLTLAVQGNIQGPVSDGFRVLNESPLADIVGPTFAAWTASGSLDTHLQLAMDLSDTSAPPRVDVSTQWRDVELQIMPGQLPLQAVNGEFSYSTEKGFSSAGLAATLWGNRVGATLNQHYSAPANAYDPATTIVDIALSTRVKMADIRRWLQLDSLAFVSGQAVADVGFRLVPGAPPVLTVNSDLKGVALDLPKPWQKAPGEEQALLIEIPLAPGVMSISMSLQEQLHLRMDLASGVLRAAALGLYAPAAPTEAGVLRVTGHAPLIQADEWLAFARQSIGDAVTSEAATSGPPLTIAVDELRADTVVILERKFDDVVFSLAGDREQWAMALTTDWLTSAASFGGDGERIQVDIDYLDIDHLPETMPSRKSADSDSTDASDAQSNGVVELPDMRVAMSNLFQSEQRLGELNFELQWQADRLTVGNISGELAGLEMSAEQPGQLVWYQGAQPYTRLQAHLQFGNLGQTLQSFDYQRTVETKSGEFTVDLRWPGAPANFSLLEGEGAVQIQIGTGSFLQAPVSAEGALRVVSILNLADIVRRMSVSTMFESGIPFDSVDGEVGLADGKLTVARMDVQGGSSFQFSGVSDVRSKSLDGELVATLPVVSNLPWIAALAAGLPVAAGVYVVSKVFNKEMNRLSSAVYDVGGTWDNPEINFDHIYDDTPPGATEEAVAPEIDAAPLPLESAPVRAVPLAPEETAQSLSP